MKRFVRGSEWRKWDLHVHPPGTKLSDGYTQKNGDFDWERFCQIIYESDVAAIGITDYFSLDGFFDFIEKYYYFYPDSNKIFFPNLELRLNEVVNGAGEVVDFHIIFPPNLTREKATEFLSELKTQNTDSCGKKQSCAQLKTCNDYEITTVSRDDIKEAIKKAYGSKAVETDCLIMIAAANNNGIRADKSSKRKSYLADEIDKFADGVFGNPNNVKYFQDPDRLEASDQKAIPKPVFAGSDAHNFDDLKAWLGNEVTGNNEKHVTWIKADITFQGLQQTIIEPLERVRIQSTVPDKKEPYKVISRIIFEDTKDFPREVIFNPGLNAIIGSRSSGKSALLAYVAHAVDPDYTVNQQVAATGLKEREVGPGAAITWSTVKEINYKVEWQASKATAGRVIYIPQNSLYAISERPDEITAKIRPTVFRGNPEFETSFNKTIADIESLNHSIQEAITEWFSLATEISRLKEEIRSLGDREAINERKTELTDQILILQGSSAFNREEVELYQQIKVDIGKQEARLKEIEQEKRLLSPYVVLSNNKCIYEVTNQVSVNVTMSPDLSLMPNALKNRLNDLLTETQAPLLKSLKFCITEYREALDTEHKRLNEAIEQLLSDNKKLV
jgi:hypothetical protein